MRKLLLTALITFSVFSPLTWAGSTIDFFVEIDLVERSAKGNMVDARFSEKEHERIGCGLSAMTFSNGETAEQGWCQASLSKGENTICFTENPILLDTIKAIDDYSYISFKWNKLGDCDFIHASTQSQYIP